LRAGPTSFPTMKASLRTHARQVTRFLVVGGVGFLVDASALLVMVHWAGLSRIGSRIPSLLIALTTTWCLHRSFTFGSPERPAPTAAEWLRSVFANGIGNALNLGLYWIMVASGWALLIALTIASIAAVAINYSASVWWVLRPHRSTLQAPRE